MTVNNLLYKRELHINDHISISIPTVGDVLDNEESYYSVVSMLTGMPIDFMVQLDDIGVDFAEIDDYQLFLLLFNNLKNMNTSMVLGDLNLKSFQIAINPNNNELIFLDRASGACIDRGLHSQIATALRKIHFLEKDIRKPANKEAKEYMIERARKKLQRQQKQGRESQLEGFIVSLANTPEFHYGYDEIRNLTIYQFNQSLRQIIHKIDYDNRMRGVYAGTVDVKTLSQAELTWLNYKGGL